jgi:hypothetical protein
VLASSPEQRCARIPPQPRKFTAKRQILYYIIINRSKDEPLFFSLLHLGTSVRVGRTTTSSTMWISCQNGRKRRARRSSRPIDVLLISQCHFYSVPAGAYFLLHYSDCSCLSRVTGCASSAREQRDFLFCSRRHVKYLNFKPANYNSAQARLT